jgi:hypothetical protein
MNDGWVFEGLRQVGVGLPILSGPHKKGTIPAKIAFIPASRSPQSPNR